MKKKYESKDRLPGYSIEDMYSLDEAIRLGMTKEEFEGYNDYWNMPRVMIQLLILKELREIKKLLKEA